MRCYIGKDADSGKIVIGHELVFFGSHTRIQIKGKGKNDSGRSCTVDPDSIHVIEGDIQRVQCISTGSGVVTAPAIE